MLGTLSSPRMSFSPTQAWTSKIWIICWPDYTLKVLHQSKTPMLRPSTRTYTLTIIKLNNSTTKLVRIQISQIWLNSKVKLSVQVFSNRNINRSYKIVTAVLSRWDLALSPWATSLRGVSTTIRSIKPQAPGQRTWALKMRSWLVHLILCSKDLKPATRKKL